MTTAVLVRLVGGPFDGKVCASFGGRPLILVGSPRHESLLDDVVAEAHWLRELRWYEIPAVREVRSG